jgi:hypothetical protein
MCEKSNAFLLLNYSTFWINREYNSRFIQKPSVSGHCRFYRPFIPGPRNFVSANIPQRL